jgi:RHS repeat-associated protein
VQRHHTYRLRRLESSSARSDLSVTQADLQADANADRGIYKIGERFYDPQIGRWTQQDPMNGAGDLREGNGYVYAGGDPANRTDPSGLWAVLAECHAYYGVGGSAGFVGGTGGVGATGSLGAGIGADCGGGYSSGDVSSGYGVESRACL